MFGSDSRSKGEPNGAIAFFCVSIAVIVLQAVVIILLVLKITKPLFKLQKIVEEASAASEMALQQKQAPSFIIGGRRRHRSSGSGTTSSFVNEGGAAAEGDGYYDEGQDNIAAPFSYQIDRFSFKTRGNNNSSVISQNIERLMMMDADEEERRGGHAAREDDDGLDIMIPEGMPTEVEDLYVAQIKILLNLKMYQRMVTRLSIRLAATTARDTTTRYSRPNPDG